MSSPRPAGGGPQTVLLVEDDAEVRVVLRMMLETHGYPVREADNGDEALRLFRQDPTAVRLLIADVALPGMTGTELAARISSERPDLPVLFISGYPYDALVQEGRLSPDAEFLQKPFPPAVLAGKVRELLESPPSPITAPLDRADSI